MDVEHCPWTVDILRAKFNRIDILSPVKWAGSIQDESRKLQYISDQTLPKKSPENGK